jgi:hypothetical protein
MPRMEEGIVDKDKNVYFLHIAETGGRALKDFVLNPLFKKDADIVGKHDGWSEFIDDKTYIVCILRDPVKHACGFYLHFINKEKDGIDLKSQFLDYYRNTKQIHNFQSQNLVISGQNFHYGEGRHFTVDSHFNPNFIIIDEDVLQKRIDRIDLLISQDFLLNNIQSVANIMADDLDLEYIEVVNVDNIKYKNEMSRTLYNSLTEEEKQEIQDLNSIDYKIYSQLRNKELQKNGEI